MKKEIIEKFQQQEKIMARVKGPFDLFALFLREDAPNKWDLVVAAEWIEKSKESAIKYIADIMQKSLSREELLLLSRIAIIDERNPELQVLQKVIQIEHGSAEFKDSNFFGLQIKHMYLITSRRREHTTPNNPIGSDG